MKRQDIYIEFPTTWDELTSADWREMLRLRHRLLTTSGQWTPHDVRIKAACLLLKQRGVTSQPDNERYLTLVSQLAKSLTWLWQDKEGVLSLTLRTTLQLMPMVRQWHGPMSHGADMTFGEFREAVTHMRVWEQDRNETALMALAGLLYRPVTNGTRQPYGADVMAAKIARGRQMQPWQRWGAYAWLDFFCEYLAMGTFILEGRQVTFAPLFTHGEGRHSSTLAQVGMTVAESGVFGPLRDVDNTLLLDVMQKLLQDYEAYQRLKKHKP